MRAMETGAPGFVCLKTEKEMQPLAPVQKVSPLPKQLDSRTKKEEGKERNVSRATNAQTQCQGLGWTICPTPDLSQVPPLEPFSFLLGLLVRGRGDTQARRDSSIDGDSRHLCCLPLRLHMMCLCSEISRAGRASEPYFTDKRNKDLQLSLEL